MPKKVVSFFPRRKAGKEPDGRLTRRISVSYEDLETRFHLPLKDAAREINLCATTFKKACRSFGMEDWPFRKGRSQVPIAQMKPVYPPAAPPLQTPAIHHASRAVVVSCTSPVCHDGSSEKMDTSSFGFPYSYSSVAPSSSNVSASAGRSRDGLDPFSTVFCGPMALATRSYGGARHATHGETRYAGLSLPGFSSAAPQGLLQQASMVRDTRSFVGVPLPMLEDLPMTRPLGGAQGGPLLLEPCPPRELSWVEAVMDYLESPPVGDFEFMFVDEEGAPESGASLDGDDDGTE